MSLSKGQPPSCPWRIRAASVDDAPGILAIYAPIVETTAISFEDVPPSIAEMRGRVEKTLASYPWLVIEDEAGVMGYAYGSRWRERAAYARSVEVTVYVHERARGRGVARALYDDLLASLSARGFHRAFAGIALPNDASVALHRAVGFTVVGVFHQAGFKFDAWHDVLWMERAL